MLVLSLIVNVLLLAGVIYFFMEYRRNCLRHDAGQPEEPAAVPAPEEPEEPEAPAPQEKEPVVEESVGQDLVMCVGIDAETARTLSVNLQSDYRLMFIDDSRKVPEMAGVMRPVLILSEFLMPGLNGEELCHTLRLRPETSRIPVVFLTVLANSADIVYGLEAGARDYITKPFDVEVLRSRLRKIIDEYKNTGMSEEAQPVAETEMSPQDKKFHDALDAVIRNHLSDSEFSVNDICMELGMSRTAMFNRVKSLTGHSPNDYLRVYRLNEARRLLEARLWSIAEIAVKVGYNDPKYFSTSFKKQFGVSPSKF